VVRMSIVARPFRHMPSWRASRQLYLASWHCFMSFTF